MVDLDKIQGFDWDTGNARKNEKHEVTQTEAEQVFFSENLFITPDERHSEEEHGYRALGETASGRHLTVIFTLRQAGTLIRVISARNMNDKERMLYEQEIKKIPKFKSEEEERRFWETHDTTGYFDSLKTVRARFPSLKPSTQSISLRLPLSLLEAIRIEANKRDVPYQSLIKVWLSERLKQRTSA